MYIYIYIFFKYLKGYIILFVYCALKLKFLQYLEVEKLRCGSLFYKESIGGKITLMSFHWLQIIMNFVKLKILNLSANRFGLNFKFYNRTIIIFEIGKKINVEI